MRTTDGSYHPRRSAKRSSTSTGTASSIQISFPGQAPIQVTVPITVFNGGTEGGRTTLYVHTHITVPVPAALVTTVTIRKVNKGRYGWSAVAELPVIFKNEAGDRKTTTISGEVIRPCTPKS